MLIIFFNVSYISIYICNMYHMYIYRFDVSSSQLKENKLLIHKTLHTFRVAWEMEFVADVRVVLAPHMVQYPKWGSTLVP